jgi:hypothetical protein
MKQPYRESQQVAVKEEQKEEVTEEMKMAKLSTYLQQGLEETEAAILAGFSEAEIEAKKKKSTEFADFVRLQKIKFKQAHLKTIAGKSDAKTSQWMLEKTFPESYGKQNGVPLDDGDGATMVAAIIRTIQRKDAQPVKVPFQIVSDKEKISRHNETERFEEGDKSLNPGGENILR